MYEMSAVLFSLVILEDEVSSEFLMPMLNFVFFLGFVLFNDLT